MSPGPRLAPLRATALGPRGLHRVMRSLFTFDACGAPRLLCEEDYLFQILRAVAAGERHDAEVREAAQRLLDSPGPDRDAAFNCLQNALDRYARIEVGGTDSAPDDSPPAGPLLPVVLYLDAIRSPFNTGNIIRSAAAFGITGLVLGEGCPSLNHPRLVRAAMGSRELVECREGDISEAYRMLRVSTGGRIHLYALETGGIPLGAAPLALPAVAILGHEERGVSAALLDQARRTGCVVSIAHRGFKHSLNVGVAAGILLNRLQELSETGVRNRADSPGAQAGFRRDSGAPGA